MWVRRVWEDKCDDPFDRMDCPHLSMIGPSLAGPETMTDPDPMVCSSCDTVDSLWVCYHCGQVGCGRQMEGHALLHFQDNNSHFLTMDCKSYQAYWNKNSLNERNLDLLDPITSLVKGGAMESSEVMLVKENGKRKRGRNRGGNNNDHSKPSSDRNNKRSKSCNVSGLKNMGNTCFINAVMHSLSNLHPVVSYFTKMSPLETGPSLSNPKDPTMSALPLAEGIRITLSDLNQTKGAVHPYELLSVIYKLVPRYKGYHQHDAHEFLTCILDRLHTELTTLNKHQQPPPPPQVTQSNIVTSNSTTHPSMGHVSSLTSNDLNPVANGHGNPCPRTDNHRVNNRVDMVVDDDDDGLDTEFGGFGARTLVTNTFGGLLQNEMTCLVCRNRFWKNDPFFDLSLEIPNTISSTSSSPASTFNDRGQGSPDSSGNSNQSEPTSSSGGDIMSADTNNTNRVSCHILDCLRSFIQIEELQETELYLCPTCNKKQRSTKRFQIRQLPEVLCLQLKRFQWGKHRQKIDTVVKFPLRNLDMTEFLPAQDQDRSDNMYDLKAVILHEGSGMGSGHYTTYSATETPDKWYHYNDSIVRICDDETVESSQAYVLFYVRHGIRNQGS